MSKDTDPNGRIPDAELERFFHLSLDLLCIADFDGRFRRLNPAWTTILGFTMEELLATPYIELVHPDDRAKTREEAARLATGGDTLFFENRYRCKDGDYKLLMWTATASQESRRIYALARDITERQRLREELTAVRAKEERQRSERHYRELIESSAYGVYHSAMDGRLLEVNPALAAMLGYDSPAELLGRNVARDVFKSAQTRNEIVQQAIASGRMEAHEVEWERKDGKSIRVHLSGRLLRNVAGEPAGIEAIVEDMTARYSLENQLRLAQKMEAVGRLAGGVAHDFNNLLGVITGYGELALQRENLDPKLRAQIEQIYKAALRAASLTRQLLAFSRKQVMEPRVLDLNTLVADMGNLFQRLIGEDIRLVLVPASGLGRVRVDPGQIEQVLMNLVINSREAMPGGGKLTIETANADLDESYASTHIAVRPGPYVLLAISDSGVGMSAETVQHVFEPFFTTKERGTGLGLATVYGIVKQSGGYIWVYSEEGRGTTFRIYLPRVFDPAETAAKPVMAAAPGGQETILLVEDANALRAVTAQFLEAAGYTVLQAEGGPQAIQLASEHPREIQLLLTDVVMPEMSGRDLARQLALQFPAMKALYVSGYTDDALVHHGVLEAGLHLLSKPYSRSALLRKVREVLDSRTHLAAAPGGARGAGRRRETRGI